MRTVEVPKTVEIRMQRSVKSEPLNYTASAS